MSMDESVMIEVLKAITRVETKLDALSAEDRAEDSSEKEGMSDSDKAEFQNMLGAGGGSNQLSFEMPPFILD